MQLEEAGGSPATLLQALTHNLGMKLSTSIRAGTSKSALPSRRYAAAGGDMGSTRGQDV